MTRRRAEVRAGVEQPTRHARMPRIDDALIARVFRTARGERWSVPIAAFAEALERSVAHWSGDRTPSAADCERYLVSLHLEDLGARLRMRGSGTARRGTISCWSIGRASIAPPTRSIAAVARGSSPTRSTASFLG